MISKLRILFWMLLAPALLFIAAIEIFKSTGDAVAIPQIPAAVPGIPAAIPAAVFILAVAMSVALPVFLRSLFAAGLRGRESTAAADFYLYQLRVLVCVCSTPYLAAVASLLMFPEFFHAGIVLAMLYGCYFHYPSHKKIESEKRMFRVRM